MHASWIELSRDALGRNLRFLRRRLGPGPTMASVVKGNAYGHGIDVFVPLAEELGVTTFATFSAAEARRVLACRSRPGALIIMGAIDRAEIEWAVESDVSFYVFDLDRLSAAARAGGAVGRPARVHLELETGMHRLGFERHELPAVAASIRDAGEQLVVEGVCTHFAGAESITNHVRVQQQAATFGEMCAELAAAGVRPGRRHAACSAAALVYPETVLDMARIGIAQYGYWPSKEVQMRLYLEGGGEAADHRWTDPLRRVISWKSRVMAVKEVPPGEFIGYGTSYLANSRKRIAVVPVGYASGFTRRLSNTGRVLIRGRRFGVVGRVNMSMMSVDVTDARDVVPGDEVVLIGTQGKRAISVSSFSEMSQFLNYEMLVRLPPEIPRTVVAR